MTEGFVESLVEATPPLSNRLKPALGLGKHPAHTEARLTFALLVLGCYRAPPLARLTREASRGLQLAARSMVDGSDRRLGVANLGHTRQWEAEREGNLAAIASVSSSRAYR